jgi:hypothetical protein
VFQYPLHLTFKFWTLASNRVTVKDSQGNLLFLLHQKALKLKQVIVAYGDEKSTQSLDEIKADRIIDFSARYNFIDAGGINVGGVKRQGFRSLWRARYDIFGGGNHPNPVMSIWEENPWLQVCDALLSEIPVVGLFTGYFFNPTYTVTRPDEQIVMRLAKKSGFLSRHFTIMMVNQLQEEEEQQALLSILMMILLERRRG